jgi:phosphatidylglycerophosphate synthase
VVDSLRRELLRLAGLNYNRIIAWIILVREMLVLFAGIVKCKRIKSIKDENSRRSRYATLTRTPRPTYIPVLLVNYLPVLKLPRESSKNGYSTSSINSNCKISTSLRYYIYICIFLLYVCYVYICIFMQM